MATPMTTSAVPSAVPPPMAGPTDSVATIPDPPSVISKLRPSLSEQGCIQNPQDVTRVVDYMKESDLMVNRCIILNVIKATDAPSTLEKFMDLGGWGVLNVWLAEAKTMQNTALLAELLQVLQKLPVGIEALKQGNMGKLIKQLSKQETGEIQSLAGAILAKWMAVFREGQSAKAKSAEERRNSANDDNSAPTSTSSSGAKAPPLKKKSSSRKKESGKKGEAPESMQPPPGPLVALGRPKDKAHKRPRDLLVGQPPAEKKSKASPAQAADNSSKAGKAFVESEGFMNALSTQAAKLKEKKIKRVPKINKLGRTNSSSEPLPAESKQEPPTSANEEGGTSTVEGMEGVEDGKKKKKVSWATEDNLTKVHYFHLDESERVNVNRRTSFLDAAQQEKMREREALESGLMFSRDRLIEMIPWKRPLVLEFPVVDGEAVPGNLVVRGLESKEMEVQAEREGKVLAQLFLNKASVQPSPMEPDPEPDMVETEPKLIPLLEPNAPGGNQNQQPPPFGSPTAMAPTGPGVIPPGSPLPSPATTIDQAQSLINYFNMHGPSRRGLPGSRGRGGPPGRDGPNPASSPHQGPDGNYYPRGGPPQQGESGGPPMGPPGQWRAEGGAYNEERHYRGPGGPIMRRGHGYMPFRGRGRGFFRKGQICKHFLTHGCKLGAKCRFMHCSPEELANKMATNEKGFSRRPPRGRGMRFEGPGRPPHNGATFLPPPKPSPPQNASSPPIHNLAGAPQEQVPPPKHELTNSSAESDTAVHE